MEKDNKGRRGRRRGEIEWKSEEYDRGTAADRDGIDPRLITGAGGGESSRKRSEADTCDNEITYFVWG